MREAVLLCGEVEAGRRGLGEREEPGKHTSEEARVVCRGTAHVARHQRVKSGEHKQVRVGVQNPSWEELKCRPAFAWCPEAA